jgi:heme-degrading monooxygenase HmoA
MSIFHWGNLKKHIEKFQESHPGMRKNEEIRGFKAFDSWRCDKNDGYFLDLT